MVEEGGNARFSGGGGGANAGSGGKGGYELNTCGPAIDVGGLGGHYFPPTFYANSGAYSNRIYMGGGGGCSTQDPDQGKIATSGGNGGGIVIILANKLISSGHSIKANGQSVSGISTSGAGGGGAGGVILTDISEFVDNLRLELNGGNGGNTFAGVDSAGPGGGGGGGIYWFSQGSLPAKVSFNASSGFAGKVGSITNGAGNGSFGRNLSNLVIPRRGFLDNRIAEDQLICGGTAPEALNFPEAKGGSAPSYTYQWIQSEFSANGPWVPASGINNNQNYYPPVLYDTTYYARVVSDGTLTDTSFALMIAVHPYLQNNSINGKDTVCANLSPGILTSAEAIIGGLGNGTYSYQWEYSPDNNSWNAASGVNSQFSYNTPALSETTFYRRRVSSGACVDTSNSFKVVVLPSLTNNNIESDQIICFDQKPSVLTGTMPAGGLESDRRYRWQSAIIPGNWSDEVDSPSFAPEALKDTTYFRRIVYSGPDNTCINISDSVIISVLPEIENNVLFHSDTTICSGLPELSLSGSQPYGGDGTYKYIWEKKSFPDGAWVKAEESAILKTFQTGSLNDTVFFRRVVKSGSGDVCVNNSEPLLVNVLPFISNNSISGAQLICEDDVPLALTGSEPKGGEGVYSFIWQQSPDGISDWNDALPSGNEKNYNPPSLTNTTFYRRVVFSGPGNTCQDLSANVKIEVNPAIQNNKILTQNPHFTCFNTLPAPILGSTGISGGDGQSYSFLWQQSNNLSVWGPATQLNNQPSYQAEALSEKKYYRRIVSSGACKDTTEFIEVDINPLPVLTGLSKTQQLTYICDDEAFGLKVEIETGKAPYTIGYKNGIDTEVFYQNLQTDTSSFNVNIYGADPNSFNFTLESLIDENGCRATDLNLSAFQIPLDVYRAALPKINMSDTVGVCGNSIVLSSIPDIGNGYWSHENSQILINDTLSTSPTASVTIDPFNHISDKFYFIESTPGCGSRKDSVVVNFYEEPSPALIKREADVSSHLIVFLSDNIKLDAETPTAGSGHWHIISGPGTISSQDNNSVSIKDLIIDEETKISFTISNGVCELKKDELIIERKDLKIYEGFSPNGDLINDFLYTEGLDRSSPDISYTFSIFNSKGAFVREIKKDTQLDTQENNVIWDGKLAGGSMAGEGTYYYVLKIDYKGKEFVFKGFFVLKTE